MKTNKAYSILGLTKEISYSLYGHKSLVRSHLEYANSVWSPYIKRWCWGYREGSENSYFFKTLSYTDHLVPLGLPTQHKYDYKVAPEMIYNINKKREEIILDCQKVEVIMILGNFRSLIELLIFGTACLML